VFVFSHKVDYEPMMIALEKGYFADEGIEVITREVVGGIQAAEAMATGSADIGAMGDAPAIILTSRRDSVKIIARYGGGEKMHRVIAQKGIAAPKDLEGKRVGIQLGSSTHGGVMQWAGKNNIDMERVQLVSISPMDMPDAMKTSQIDAMAGSEPWPTNVETHCGDRVSELADFRDVGNTFPLVLVASERLITESPEVLESILRGVKKGTEFINRNFEEAAQIAVSYTGLSPENQRRCMGSLFWEVGFDSTDLKSLQMTAKFLKDFGKIDVIPDFAKVVDTSLLENMINE
jgi:ABC-type nitrate/sulfonate/bicarbonate transport system substrate-binding protein